MTTYDRLITQGHSHRCVCGAIWTDSDGHPCHYRCECGRIVFDGDECECEYETALNSDTEKNAV